MQQYDPSHTHVDAPGGEGMERIGQYELLALVGEGGMGEVWRARDLRHGRDVALKLLPAALSGNAEYHERFRLESDIVARLREPHLIPIHDHGEIDGRLFLDMRLVEGRSLQGVLRDEGPLSPRRSVALVAQIAEALDAAHADGLVHRDVKPSNVLVTPSDFVYVVDFGLAFAVGTPRPQLTQTGVALGTLEYMAPERFAQQPVDARTDVYSLACVLFECLTKQKPFPGDFPTQMYGHLNLDPPRCSEIRPEVPAAFDRVIARGLAKAPDDRFRSAGALAAAARAALRRRPDPLDAPTVAAPAVTPGHRVAVTTTIAPTRRQGAVALAPPPPARPSVAPGPRDPHPSGPTPGAPLPSGSDRAAGPAPEPAPGPVRRLRRWWVAGALVAVLAVAALVLTMLPGTPTARPTPVPSRPDPTVSGTVPVGTAPVAVAVAPDGRFAYVADRDASAVTVFDTVGGVARGSIPLPGRPQAVVFAPDGRRAYVALALDAAGEVAVVDTGTGAVAARIPTGSPPRSLAVAPDGGRVYASDPDPAAVVVIDPDREAVVDRIPVAPTPHGLAVSPDGRRLAVADHDADLLTVLDLAGGAAPETVRVGDGPHAVTWDLTRPWVFVTDFTGNAVSVVDVAAAEVVATVPTAVHPQDVTTSADGRHAYVAAIDANVVQVLDTATATITATVPTGRAPSSVAVTPDGRRAYVTDLLDGTLTVLETAAPR